MFRIRHRLSKGVFFGFTVISLIVSSGCSINPVWYSDGQLTNYFQQPIPKLTKPVAATLSFKSVTYNSAASLKGSYQTHLNPNNLFTLPAKVGTQVQTLLQLDQKYSEHSTVAALNAIAKAQAEARMQNNSSASLSIPVANSGSNQFIQRQSQLASDAYSKGDYLVGNTHTSAMETGIAMQRVEAGIGVMNATVGLINAMASAGMTLKIDDFNRLHNWLLTSSGAIGPQAPKNRHLDVFFRFLDGQMFSTESNMRLAVMLVLLDENGIVARIVEGSDVLSCNNKCSRLSPKPTAQLINQSTHLPQVQKQLWTPEGWGYLSGSVVDWQLAGKLHSIMSWPSILLI